MVAGHKPVKPGPQFLNVKQVAERLNCSIKLVYRLCDEGAIGHSRFGKALVRISEEQLAEYVARCSHKPTDTK